MPKDFKMNGYGFFEGYTHLANMFICNFENSSEKIHLIREIIEENKEISGGVTLTKNENICVKILGNSGEVLSNLCNNILKII